MGELVSIAPTAGGQYHWVAMLAPPSSRKFLSYITGWLTCAGWQAAIATAAFFTGTLIQGLIVENHSDYSFQRWHGTLLTWAAVLLAVIFNTVLSPALPKVEGMVLVLHILGFFAILIPLVYLAPHSAPSEVFTVFLNSGGWRSQGLSFFIGLIGNATAFLGTDGAIHMCEEIRNASTVVPQTMIASLMINGVLAFSMLVAVLFCIGDITAAVGSPTGYPFIEIFTQATASKAGATVMTSIVTTLSFCAIIAALAGSSRMTWSFARDRGLPGWRYLSKVDTRTSIPLISIAISTINSCLLVIINVGSSTAFNDVVSLVISCYYSSYLIVCVLLLYRRITNTIQPLQQDRSQVSGETQQITWGPWHVHGALGIANNLFACVFLVILLFFSFWPEATPTTAATMNYSVLVTGLVVSFSVLYYLVWARRFYTGPVVEIHSN